MSDTPKQSPLGINVLGSLLSNSGLNIIPTFSGYIGTSTGSTNYTNGSIVANTLLNKITSALNQAYGLLGADITGTTYQNMTSIGSTTIPALGNSAPGTYRTLTVTQTKSPNTVVCNSTAGFESGQSVIFSGVGFGSLIAGTVYTIGSVTSSTEFTLTSAQVNATGSMTMNNLGLDSYGFLRLIALQAYNEFNYNNKLPQYTEFLSSFIQAYSYVVQTNPTIVTLSKSNTFLDGSYSNMNDLITADIAGVSLSTTIFGSDLIALGKALDLVSISTFGLPSNLLRTLKKHSAITTEVNIAVMSQEVSPSDYTQLISNNFVGVTVEQERKFYAAFELIQGQDLATILIALNCKTPGITKLSDLLNPVKLFPNSYLSLTVSVYNTEPGPTNSKTYYPIYSQDGGVNGLISGINVGNELSQQYPDTNALEVTVTAPTVNLPKNYSDIASGSASDAYNANAVVNNNIVENILNIVKR
jgi:hypothetical protein